MFGSARLSMIGLIAIFAFVSAAYTASASILQDIESGMADSLGVSTAVAGTILSAAILLSAGLALSVGKSGNMALTVIILLGLMGMLTAIGWLEGWLIIMTALVIALFFGSKLREWGEANMSKR